MTSMKVITLRVENDLHDKLGELADSERRSLNQQIILLLEAALKDRQDA
jgi:hypothetical protein